MFFFKQKTAYEMRISDWSSDVCSSDLRLVVEPDFAVRQMRLGEARDGAQCRGLAGAVAPEQGDDLPFVHIEADVLDDVALAVESLEAPGREDRKSTSLNSSH